jgi:CBS-domain-containing membrane protein
MGCHVRPTPPVLFQFPGMGDHEVSPSATNADALQRMTDDKLIAIPVVDEDRRLRGIVEREQLISRLVLSLVQATNLPEA